MMDRIKWIEYKGKKILDIDYSDLTKEQIIEVINQLEPFFISQQKNSILSVTNFSNSYVNSDIYKALKEVTKNFCEYDKKVAVFGLNKAKNVFLKLIRRFSNNKIYAFNSKEDALEWLIR